MSSIYTTTQRIFTDKKRSRLALVKFSILKSHNPSEDLFKQSVGAIMTLDGDNWTTVDFKTFKKEWRLLK